MKFLRADTAIYCEPRPIDRDDPDAARTAIGYDLPTGFSIKAKRFWKYLEGSAFIFEVRDKLIVTDESLELSSGGDGTRGNPFRCIRGSFDCWEDLERWLEAEYDAAIAEGWL